jgi:hypothetical protein
MPPCAKTGCFAAQWAVSVAYPGLPWHRQYRSFCLMPLGRRVTVGFCDVGRGRSCR